MAETFYTILTAIGRGKLANAIPLQQPVNLTALKVGDSGGAYRNPADTDLDVVGEKWSGPINALYVDPDNPNYMIVEAVITAEIGSFYVREVGVFDQAGDMIAIGKYPETYKPELPAGAGKDLYIKFVMEVSNTAAVTLRINPATVLATRQYADGLMGTAASTRRITQSGPVLTNDTSLLVDATAGDIDLTFLSAAATTSRGIRIKRVDSTANRVRLLPQPGQTIEWGSYMDIPYRGAAYHFQPDGASNWLEMSRKMSAVIGAMGIADLRNQTASHGYITTISHRTAPGDGGGGQFRWDSSDLSAEVSADSLSGIYVAPNSDPTGASGAWVRQFLDAVNVAWFGAAGDGVTDDTDAIQAALDCGESVQFPEGTFAVGSSVLLRVGQTRKSIRGVRGKTTIYLTANVNAFQPAAQYNAEVMEIYGLRFVSAANGTGTAIYSPSDVYVSHLYLHDCVFSQSLRYGINANVVGSRVVGNDFGEAATGVGHNFQAIRITGPADLSFNPNANIVAQNWIKRSGGADVEYAVEFGEGVVNLFTQNLVEQNTSSVAALGFAGSFYPKIVGNYFENNAGSAVAKFTDGPGGRTPHLIRFDDNYVRGYASKPSTYVLDMVGCTTAFFTFDCNLLPGLEIANIIRDKDGSVDTLTYLVSNRKTHVTGAYAGEYATINTAGFTQLGISATNPTIKNAAPQITLHDIDSGETAHFKFRTNASTELSAGTGGDIYFKANGSDQVRVAGGGGFYPTADNGKLLGTTNFRWAQVYGTQFRPGAGAVIWTSGDGSPEGVVTAPPGSLYTNGEGGAGTTLYVKESGSGNTGWVAK